MASSSMDRMFRDAFLQANWSPLDAFELPYDDGVQTRSVKAQGDPIEEYQLSLLLVGLDPTTYPCLKAAISPPAGTQSTPQLNRAAAEHVTGLFNTLRTARPNPLALIKDPKEKNVLK